MATSLEVSKNEVQIEHATQFPSVILFSAETTRLIFTKILQDIVAVVMLSNHAFSAFLSERQSNE